MQHAVPTLKYGSLSGKAEEGVLVDRLDFTRFFRKMAGVTPEEFRKSIHR